ncbi:ABC transporter substrate-binding protein [Pseudarthrobacter raffinosi]|uniref:ABC transporter substrate-binding protein n=1 Tax=Pseudarthrobacter raffinosi TaxID=2953651 RepID=UPI00208F8F89|nr:MULTISPECIES: ABC transporter substrate-binding protein [unclassified Pseudarthrobacter]MCO4251557.1 ABC transporter substrate-binding protein [Pseudarthrobacter sp. MDT3-9]MCO4264594.1 ABC transporter substrate-binding protein [Pseudarthrobacter sp. MDT3-26]
MQSTLGNPDRRGFLKLSAAAGGVVFLGLTTGCGQAGGSGGGASKGYSGDVAITGLASLIHSAPFFIAQSEGYYEEEGLTLEHIQFPGGLDTVRGIESGIGFGTSSTIPVFIAAEKGMDVRIFGNLYTAASVDFIALADSPIKTIQDLKGKKVAVSTPGSNSSYFADRTLREAGLVPGKDVELISVGSASDSWTAVSKNVVDVAWTASPLSEKIASESGGKVIWRSRDYVTDWSDTCLVATGSFIDKNTEAMKGWGRALQKAMDLISNDLEKAADAYGKAIKYEPKVALEALKNSQKFYSLDFTDAQLAAVVAAGKAQGQLTKEPDMNAIVMKNFLS